MFRSYTGRMKVTRKQSLALEALLSELCELYNAALQERRDAWKVCRKQITYYDQQEELTQLRALDPESAAFPVAIQRDPLRRVKRAFDGFFRRLKQKQKAGYPRFRSRERYDSFTVDSGSFSVEGCMVIIPKLGGLRFRTRCKIKGKPKTLHVRRCGKKWRAVIVCDIGPAAAKIAVSNAVGIDVGLTTLATLSDGREIENPRWTKQAQEHLAFASRSLSRKKRGSTNRAKARERLRRVHESIQGRRRSYLHAVSGWLVSQYDLIAFEKLDISGLMQNGHAKSIMDAAWNELIWQITYKAENAGKWAVPVKAKDTTQLCSGCGERVPKKLWQRQHDCPSCGLSLGRDHNAALNILRRGECLVEDGRIFPTGIIVAEKL